MGIAQYLEDNSEMRERFIDHAFNNNPNISTLDEFTDALNRAFNTEKGRRVLDKLDYEEFKILWGSSELNSRADFKRNRKEKGLPEDTDDEVRDDYEIDRRVKVGKPTRPKDIVVIRISKPYKTKSYNRQGKTIKGYKKSYNSWKPSQLEFLKESKRMNKPPRTTISEFKMHFKDSNHTSSSIRTKLYRTK